MSEKTFPFGPEYPKINTIYKRDMENNGLIMPGHYSTPEFEYLSDKRWHWTEKVDGTNIRVHFDGTKVTINGRTDSAQVPGPLFYALAHLNNPSLFDRVFGDSTLVKPYAQDVTIYGEGYGPKIQSGGQYRNDVSFIVFDIKVGRWWLKPEDVADASEKLGLEVVPSYDDMTLDEAALFVEGFQSAWDHSMPPFKSHWLDAKPEGIVGTPVVPLFDRRGERIIAKIKTSDFEALKKHREREQQRTTTVTFTPVSGLHGHGPGYD